MLFLLRAMISRRDESSATGETNSVRKDLDGDVFFLSNTKVIEGYGSAVVCSVGESSFYGKIMMSLQTKPDDTPLTVKLDTLAENIGRLGLSAAILILFVLVIKYFVLTPSMKMK
eukprot:GABW01001353.1.p1 GENE.GABW01001353.1~~GABW01001353.1.p1  ORF type:complete len:115 (+),score=26.70 GABW01001353.1:47-391(+)